jgi:hypothetical protein
MAEVTQKRSREIDAALEWSLRSWRSLAQAARDIEGWDSIERADFLHEWPLEEQKLAELQSYAERGMMSPAQQRRHRLLRETVERNRPVIEELLDRYLGKASARPDKTP